MLREVLPGYFMADWTQDLLNIEMAIKRKQTDSQAESDLSSEFHAWKNTHLKERGKTLHNKIWLLQKDLVY